MAPRVFIVPGFWEGKDLFTPLEAELRNTGFTTHVATLPTTGTKSPGNPNIGDNVSAIHEEMSRFVDEAGDEGVLAVFHSAGGIMGSGAMRGLGARSREENGDKGGVTKIIFLAGLIVEEGDPKGLTPKGVTAAQLEQAGVVYFEDGQMLCTDPAKIFFNDLSADEAATWITNLRPEPLDGWDTPITYMGWRDIESVYILCESDHLVPPPLQEQFAGLAGSQVVRINAAHMAQVSQPAAVARIVQNVANE